MRYPPGKYYYLSFNLDFFYIGEIIIDDNTRVGEDDTLYFSNNQTVVGLGEYERYGNGKATTTINKYHNLHDNIGNLLNEVDKNNLAVKVEIFDMLFHKLTRWLT